MQKNFFSWGDICQLAPPWFWCMWLLRFPQFVRLFLQTKQGGDSCHLLLHGAGACVCCSLHSLSGCFHVNGRDTELVVKVSLSEGLILLYCLLFWCCVFAEGFWGGNCKLSDRLSSNFRPWWPSSVWLWWWWRWRPSPPGLHLSHLVSLLLLLLQAPPAGCLATTCPLAGLSGGMGLEAPPCAFVYSSCVGLRRGTWASLHSPPEFSNLSGSV